MRLRSKQKFKPQPAAPAACQKREPMIVKLSCGDVIVKARAECLESAQTSAELCPPSIWSPSEEDRRNSAAQLAPVKGSFAELRGLSMAHSAGLKHRFDMFYSTWPQKLWKLLDSDPARARATASELMNANPCGLDVQASYKVQCAANRFAELHSCPAEDFLLSGSFLASLRAAAERSGPTVSTVLEEQLHGLACKVCCPRLSKAKEVGIAMSSIFIDMWLGIHEMNRADLLALQPAVLKEAAQKMKATAAILTEAKVHHRSAKRASTVAKVRKSGHIRYASSAAAKASRASATESSRGLRSVYADAFQKALEEWKQMPAAEKEAQVLSWATDEQAIEHDAMDSDSESGDAHRQMDARLLQGVDMQEAENDSRIHFGMGSKFYPLCPELFHQHFSAEQDKLRSEQLAASGRIDRIGLERSLYTKLMESTGVVCSSVPHQEDPSFNFDKVSAEKEQAKTCFQKHPGMCSSDHGEISKDVKVITASFCQFVKTRGLRKLADGTALIRVRSSSLLHPDNDFEVFLFISELVLSPLFMMLTVWDAVVPEFPVKFPVLLEPSKPPIKHPDFGKGTYYEQGMNEFAISICDRRLRHASDRLFVDQILYEDSGTGSLCVHALQVCKVPSGASAWSLWSEKGGEGGAAIRRSQRASKRTKHTFADLKDLKDAKQQVAKSLADVQARPRRQALGSVTSRINRFHCLDF